MAQLKCPRCATVIETPATGRPVCPKCGFGSNAPRATAQASPTMSPFMQGGADPNGPPMPGRLRPVPIGKTVLLGIITFGIYLMVRTYKNSGDLHRMHGGNPNWQTFFWLRLIPYAGIIFVFILHFKNNKQANLLGQQRGLAPSYLPFILSCIPIVHIAAPFVWASQYNDLARRT